MALSGGFGGGAAAPASPPIIITSNHDDDDGGSSAPIFMPIPMPYPGYGYGARANWTNKQWYHILLFLCQYLNFDFNGLFPIIFSSLYEISYFKVDLFIFYFFIVTELFCTY